MRQIGFVRVRAMLALRGLREGTARRRFDINLMDERLRPKYVPLARRNVLLPHPEWFDAAWTPDLRLIDRVFAKTRHAVPIFESLGCRTRNSSASPSIDRRLAEIPREPDRSSAHLGGHAATARARSRSSICGCASLRGRC